MERCKLYQRAFSESQIRHSILRCQNHGNEAAGVPVVTVHELIDSNSSAQQHAL